MTSSRHVQIMKNDTKISGVWMVCSWIAVTHWEKRRKKQTHTIMNHVSLNHTNWRYAGDPFDEGMDLFRRHTHTTYYKTLAYYRQSRFNIQSIASSTKFNFAHWIENKTECYILLFKVCAIQSILASLNVFFSVSALFLYFLSFLSCSEHHHISIPSRVQ